MVLLVGILRLQQNVFILPAILVKLRKILDDGGPTVPGNRLRGNTAILTGSGDGSVPHRQREVGSGIFVQRLSGQQPVEVEGNGRLVSQSLAGVLNRIALCIHPLLVHRVGDIVLGGVGDGGDAGSGGIIGLGGVPDVTDRYALNVEPVTLFEGKAVLPALLGLVGRGAQSGGAALRDARLPPGVFQHLAIGPVQRDRDLQRGAGQSLRGKACHGADDGGAVAVRGFHPLVAAALCSHEEGKLRRHAFKFRLEGGGVPDLHHLSGGGAALPVGEGTLVVQEGVAGFPVAAVGVGDVGELAGRDGAVVIDCAEHLLIPAALHDLPDDIDIFIALGIVFGQGGISLAVCAVGEGIGGAITVIRGYRDRIAIRVPHLGGGGVGLFLPVAVEVVGGRWAACTAVVQPYLCGGIGGGAGEGQVHRAPVVDGVGSGAVAGGLGVVVGDGEVVAPVQPCYVVQPSVRIFAVLHHPVGAETPIRVVLPEAADGDPGAVRVILDRVNVSLHFLAVLYVGDAHCAALLLEIRQPDGLGCAVFIHIGQSQTVVNGRADPIQLAQGAPAQDDGDVHIGLLDIGPCGTTIAGNNIIGVDLGRRHGPGNCVTEVRLAGIRVRYSITIFPLSLVVDLGGQGGGAEGDPVAVHAGVGLHNGLGKRRQADQGQGLPLLFAAHRGEVIGIPVQREGQSGLEGRPAVYRPLALLVVVVGPQHGVGAAGTLILRMNHQPGRPGEQGGRC